MKLQESELEKPHGLVGQVKNNFCPNTARSCRGAPLCHVSAKRRRGRRRRAINDDVI